MRIEVVQALPVAQSCITLELAEGATVAEAIAASGLSVEGLDDEHVGIWNRRVTLATVLREADRVELYRPLVADPKLARRVRAERNPVGVQAKRRISRS
ncbi:MAG TPA: RnfH family protein [Patescibacteria group bacterium]|nr:RnfH family protein [Patescibacteria group bacterium]